MSTPSDHVPGAVRPAVSTPAGAVGPSPSTPLEGGTLPEAGPSQAALATAPALVPGYEILGELGHGGMGDVFRGRDPELGRELAVKVLRKELHDAPRSVQRFLEEAQVGGQLQHPGVVPVYAAGRLPDQRPYFTMKLIEGHTLAELLRRRSAAADDLPRFLKIFDQICQTVAYAHSRGVLHRDLKPLNVMVGAFGEVQVMDWGLAKLVGDHTIRTTRQAGSAARSEANSVIGTPAYMAPEQACGEVDALDARCDVFGLGAVLCEVLTGEPPYRGTELLRKAARAELGDALARLDACGADAEVVGVAKACLAAERAASPPDAGAVAEAMTSHLNGIQERLRNAEVARAAAQAKAAEERKRRRVTVAFAGFVVLALVGGGLGAGYWWQGNVTRRLAQESRDRQTDADLGRAEEALRQEDYTRTRQLLAEAGARLDAGGSATLQRRRAYLQDQLKFAADLEKMRERGTLFDPAGLRVLPVGQDYDELFSHNGLHFGQQSAAELGDAIERAPARATILQSLYHWFGNDKARRGDIAAVLDRIDTDSPWRMWARRASLEGVPDPNKDEQGPDPNAITLDDTRALIFLIRSNPDFIGPGPQPGKPPHPATARGVAEVGRMMLKLQQAHPDDFWFNVFMGSSFLTIQPRRSAAGLRFAQAALAVRPDSVIANYLVGYMLLDSPGSEDQAVFCFKHVTDQDPQHVGALMGIATALDHKGDRAEAVERKEDYASAVAAFKKAIEVNPTYAPTYSNMALTLRKQHDADAATAAVDKALEVDPNLAIAHNTLGLLLKDRGDFPGAAEHFKRATTLDPMLAEAYYNLGLVLTGQDPGGAIAAERQATKLNPAYGVAWNALGSALRDKKDLEGAVEAYQSAIGADQKNALYYSNLGEALAAKGELDAAVRECRRAVSLKGDDPVYHKNLAVALDRNANVDEAIVEYKAVARLDSTRADVWVSIGLLLQKKKDYPQAAEALLHAVGMDPGSENANWALAALFQNQGDGDKAVSYFEAVRKINPRNGDALFALGKLYLAQGRFADAEQALVEAEKYGTILPGKKLATREPIERAREMAKVGERLPLILAGKEKPADAQEMVNLGILCYEYKRMYAAAAVFYGDAFTASPMLEDARSGRRYSAACAAVLASQRQGKDADKVTDEGASQLRGRALAWLRADLAFWSKALDSERAEDGSLARGALQRWQTASDLAGVRDPEAITKLPDSERAGWQNLWTDVSAVLKAHAVKVADPPSPRGDK